MYQERTSSFNNPNRKLTSQGNQSEIEWFLPIFFLQYIVHVIIKWYLREKMNKNFKLSVIVHSFLIELHFLKLRGVLKTTSKGTTIWTYRPSRTSANLLHLELTCAHRRVTKLRRLHNIVHWVFGQLLPNKLEWKNQNRVSKIYMIWN